MSIQVNLPAGLELSEFELKMMLASKLFDEGLVTAGQGADIVGLSKRAFIELLGKYNVSLFQYDVEELKQDIANA
ncbi:MAG: UPF0175 family protein [Bacteroidota bacterium]